MTTPPPIRMNFENSSHPADVARARRRRAAAKAALRAAEESPPAWPDAVVPYQPPPSYRRFRIPPQYQDVPGPPRLELNDPNPAPWHDWLASASLDPNRQEDIRRFAEWVSDRNFPHTEPLSRSHIPIPPPTFDEPRACECLDPALFHPAANPWPPEPMQTQPSCSSCLTPSHRPFAAAPALQQTGTTRDPASESQPGPSNFTPHPSSLPTAHDPTILNHETAPSAPPPAVPPLQ